MTGRTIERIYEPDSKLGFVSDISILVEGYGIRNVISRDAEFGVNRYISRELLQELSENFISEPTTASQKSLNSIEGL